MGEPLHSLGRGILGKIGKWADRRWILITFGYPIIVIVWGIGIKNTVAGILGWIVMIIGFCMLIYAIKKYSEWEQSKKEKEN